MAGDCSYLRDCVIILLKSAVCNVWFPHRANNDLLSTGLARKRRKAILTYYITYIGDRRILGTRNWVREGRKRGSRRPARMSFYERDDRTYKVDEAKTVHDDLPRPPPPHFENAPIEAGQASTKPAHDVPWVTCTTEDTEN